MERRFDPSRPEMMDRPDADAAELLVALRNLEKINRWFGFHHLMRRFMGAWLRRGRAYRIVDLATGFGDIPRMIVDWSRRRGVNVRVIAVDAHPVTLRLAREASRDYPEIEYVEGDILSFDPGASCDVVLCSLALHHFTEADAVRVLRRAAALSHGHVLVSDLERGRVSKGAIFVMTKLLFRERMTRHDSRASVEGAFSYPEFRHLAERAGWEGFCHRRFFPARQAVWMCTERSAPTIEAEGLPDFA